MIESATLDAAQTDMLSTRAQFDAFVAQPRLLPAELLAYYDTLDPIEPEFLIGYLWRGGEFKTDIWMNGLLGVSDWYGKAFYGRNEVEALVHTFRWKNPLGIIGKLLSFWRQIRGQRGYYQLPLGVARLRQVLYRGKLSTGMAYNHLPIIDHFRQVDADTVMGVMDHKDRPQEMIIFYLHRDRPL